MGQHYGEDYDRAICRAGQDPGFWTRRRATLLRYVSSGAILDLGCSSGGFLASLKGPEWKLFGIEMSERMARQAEARTGAQVFVGDILDAPFPPESLDAITCFHVFEHLYQPKEVLAKVREWLRPGGIFYTEMPNIDSAGARIFGSYWQALELPRHVYHFSPVPLNNLARSAGLQVFSITTHREVYLEVSVRYIFDDLLGKIGIHRTPLAQAKPASLPWKVVRKGFRLSILPFLAWLATFAGHGESLHAILRKGFAERLPSGPRS
jgi:SAM-dependent methyltransferase